ncbi:MAG TPA: FUSC family protein [Pseudonocardiaceae bacterium]|nr:FUSC family protein [Pseudonocardiaceae bacterium]
MGAGPAADSRSPGPPVRAVAASSDVAAPGWLTELLVPVKAPIDWRRAGRASASIAGPIAVGVTTGHLLPGVVAAIGALCAVVTSISGPYRDRARRSGLAVGAGALGFLLGGLAGEHGWWTVALFVVAAAVSSVISAAGNNASLAGLQLLVYLILGTNESTVVNPWIALGWFAVGASWALLLSLAAWPVRATAPERALVATVLDRCAQALAVSGSPEARAARHRLTGSIDQAYDALLTARSHLQGRDDVYRRLFVVLSDSMVIVEATVSLLSARHRPPGSVVVAVRQVADAVRADRPAGDLDLPEQGSPSVLALADGLRVVAGVQAGDDLTGHPERPDLPRASRRERLALWFDDVLAGPAAWRHALRLATCMAIAEVFTMVVPLERSYWLALTVAIVLKPDFGSVFARAVQRGGGTLVGVVIGAGLLTLNPPGWVLIVLAAVIAFLLPITQVRQFGMFSTTLTPLVVILLDVGHVGGYDLILARFVDTALGCVIVLVFGYLLWPGSRRPKIGGRLAGAIDAVAAYVDLALRAHPDGRNVLRRKTYRRLSDLRTEFQRVLVEPSAAGRLAAAWYPAIIGLERLTGSVTRIAVEMSQGVPAPAGTDVDHVAEALRDLATAVREGRPPADPPAIGTDQLAGVIANLGAVVGALRGPELGEHRVLPLVRRLLPRTRPVSRP